MEMALETNILKLYLTLYSLFRVLINVTDIFVVASQNENEINISQRYHFVLGGSNYGNMSIKKT